MLIILPFIHLKYKYDTIFIRLIAALEKHVQIVFLKVFPYTNK